MKVIFQQTIPCVVEMSLEWSDFFSFEGLVLTR